MCCKNWTGWIVKWSVDGQVVVVIVVDDADDDEDVDHVVDDDDDDDGLNVKNKNNSDNVEV